jgi:hypothetical protein
MTIKHLGGIFGRNPTFNDVTVDGPLSANDNIVMANGKGIDFSATSGTGTSELFDDYEEGTWTPVGAGATATGAYTKIGNIVVAQCILRDNSVSTTSISGLPFTVGYGSSVIGGYFGRSAFGGIFDANGNEYRIRVIGTQIQFRTNVSLAGDANATVTTAGGGNVFIGITVIYMV